MEFSDRGTSVFTSCIMTPLKSGGLVSGMSHDHDTESLARQNLAESAICFPSGSEGETCGLSSIEGHRRKQTRRKRFPVVTVFLLAAL